MQTRNVINTRSKHEHTSNRTSSTDRNDLVSDDQVSNSSYPCHPVIGRAIGLKKCSLGEQTSAARAAAVPTLHPSPAPAGTSCATSAPCTSTAPLSHLRAQTAKPRTWSLSASTVMGSSLNKVSAAAAAAAGAGLRDYGSSARVFSCGGDVCFLTLLDLWRPIRSARVSSSMDKFHINM